MKLTDDERKVILEQLREEAERDLRASGCTCEPTMTMTEKGYGPYDLPMWQSDHAEDCKLALAVAAVNGKKGLMIGESLRQRMGL